MRGRDAAPTARRQPWCTCAAAVIESVALPLGLWSAVELNVGYGGTLGRGALRALFLGAPGAVLLALVAAVVALFGFARGEGMPAFVAVGFAILALLPALVAGMQAMAILTALA